MIDPDEPELERDQHVEEIEGQEDGQEVLEADGQEDAPVDDEEGHEGQVDDEPAKPLSRGEKRFQKLSNIASAAQEKAEKLERELADFRAEQRQRQQQATQETPQDRAARRALMDPLDVMREDLKESEQRTANVLHQQALQTQETNDKTTYNAILREAPHLKKYDGEVERIRKEQLAEGRFVPREVLLDLAIGRAARASAVKNAPKAKAKAAAQVAGQQVRPARAVGDTATARGRQGDSPEKRLENVPI